MIYGIICYRIDIETVVYHYYEHIVDYYGVVG